MSNQKKGGSHVVDDSRNILNFMDAWACDRLCDGLCYPPAAVALLVVSLSQEVMINQKLRHVLRGPK
jgi:hypothetical protein